MIPDDFKVAFIGRRRPGGSDEKVTSHGDADRCDIEVSRCRGVGERDLSHALYRLADGLIGTILYSSNGNRKFPKERLEVFNEGRILQLDNFRRLQGYGWPKFSTMNLRRQDKGQSACVKAYVEAIREGNVSPIPIDDIL